jgi:hypothetical protein
MRSVRSIDEGVRTRFVVDFPNINFRRGGHCFASIGLDPVSRLLGNQRTRHHSACVTQRYNLPIEPATRWSNFVADPYLLMLANFLITRSTVAGALSISPRYRVSPSRPASAMATACFFFAVSIPHENFAILSHGAPLVRRDSARPARASLVLVMARRGEPPRLGRPRA